MVTFQKKNILVKREKLHGSWFLVGKNGRQIRLNISILEIDQRLVIKICTYKTKQQKLFLKDLAVINRHLIVSPIL